jgi:hypothetical protein
MNHNVLFKNNIREHKVITEFLAVILKLRILYSYVYNNGEVCILKLRFELLQLRNFETRKLFELCTETLKL